MKILILKLPSKHKGSRGRPLFGGSYKVIYIVGSHGQIKYLLSGPPHECLCKCSSKTHEIGTM